MKTFVLAVIVSIFSLNLGAESKPAHKPARAAAHPRAAEVKPDPALTTMSGELEREMPVLSRANPPAYFVSYTLSTVARAQVMGSNGALLSSDESRSRWLESQVRVGSYDLDDTHNVGGSDRDPSSDATVVPLTNDGAGLKRALWLETEKQYRTAAEAYIKATTSNQVEAQGSEGHAPDFAHEQPQMFYGPEVSIHPERKPWEEKVRLYTRAFRPSAQVLNSIVTYTARATNQLQVNSEGTRLQFGHVHYRLELYIQGKAPDGMNIDRYYNYDWTDPSKAPSDATVLAECKALTEQLEALVKAPLIEPYAGPTLLSGRAAAVFFHEVLGHRLEGFRQKNINEGQTFTRKVGQQIMPSFISIYDDPTEKTLGNQVMIGYYPFDDEGVPSQRVTLVDHGVLRNFEMSRQPLLGFLKSNGHGRRQLGAQPISRQGNLIVKSSRTMSNAELRRKLIEEVKQQGKPFGLIIDDIEGGFTITGRGQPQAFQVQPLVVYKVFPDGRPDELVRGVDIVGTPLVSLTKIIATGNKEEIFNGYCGAESGSVPVAAVSPAILISEMEVQKKQTSTDKPPILPPPAHDPLGARP